jgi:hypothetical protein
MVATVRSMLEAKGLFWMVLGRGGEYVYVCAEHVSDEERGRHNPILGVAREEASGAPPRDLWVHRIRSE